MIVARVNFQGLGGDEANAQAQGILERAAKRARFKDVIFQYEPVAAGLDYEATCRKKNGCWWWISAVVRLTVHCC
ncbi:chaperone [Escherichia coli]|uniref:Chaperone n=1 Tax=Escherichia coli TaxID=562 RepID=A0A377BPF8_ECOLX|nr:chaperone [Escherichia coli]